MEEEKTEREGTRVNDVDGERCKIGRGRKIYVRNPESADKVVGGEREGRSEGKIDDEVRDRK